MDSLLDHSYSHELNPDKNMQQDNNMEASRNLQDPLEELPPSLANTPTKSPAPKKNKGEPSLSELQANIITALTTKIYERSDNLERMIQANSDEIAEIKTSLNFAFDEIQELKKDNTTLKEKCNKLEMSVSTLDERLSEVDQYKRRWCLRLYGLPEQESEDVKSKVLDVCMRLAPELEDSGKMAIDVAHRLGRREGNRERAVIVLFAFRWIRDLIWRKAKNSAYLKERKLRFGEDLTKMEKQMRSMLWPQVEQARKNGKRAFFRGARAFIDGREIRCVGHN